MDDNFEEVSSFNAKKEIVLSLGVYELRGLARVLGIKSPTTKKREALLEQVFAVLENNKDLSLGEIDKRGRPFKNISSVQNILDAIADSHVEENHYIKFKTFEQLTVFNQEMPPFAKQSSDIFPCSGVLRKGKNFGYFIENKTSKIVYITLEEIQKYALETGDFVSCAAYEINNGDKCFVKKVNYINGVLAEKYTCEVFDDYTQTLPTLQEVFGKQICDGGRNVLLIDSPLYLNPYVLNLLDKYKDFKVVFLGVNSCFEDINFVNNGRMVYSFTSNYASPMQEGYDKIIDTINFVERMKKLNEKVLLLIGDFGNVLHVLDSKFQDNDSSKLFGHAESPVIVAKKLISLAIAKSNEKNVTSVILCNKLDTGDTFINNELIKISNILG